MKKIITFLLFASGISSVATAQVREDKINVLDAERLGLRIEMNYDSKIVSSALADKLKEAGIKTKSSKGFVTASGVKLVDISPELMDYYFKVESIDKKRSVLYLAISKGYSNFIDPAVNQYAWDNAKTFLEGMVAYAARYQLQADAKTMEKTVSTAQKNYDKSVKDYKKQEDALAKSRKSMEDAQGELTNKKADLETLRQKIKR